MTHAQGGRDATPYLPTFLTCYLDPDTLPMITHVHMQALPANRNFVDAFGLKPVIMIRNLPDMLASYWDMLDIDPVARADGLNCLIPSNFVDKSRDAKADFMIDIVAPWYCELFRTWKDFADAAPADGLCAALRRLQRRSRRNRSSGAVTCRLCRDAREMRRGRRESLGRAQHVPLQQGLQRPRPRIFFSRTHRAAYPDAVAVSATRPWTSELLGDTAAGKIRLAS